MRLLHPRYYPPQPQTPLGLPLPSVDADIDRRRQRIEILASFSVVPLGAVTPAGRDIGYACYYGYSYFEVFGLSDNEFEDLAKFYEMLGEQEAKP